MCQRRDYHAVAFLHNGLSYGLKSPAGAGDDPSLIHVQELGQILVKLLNGRPGDLIEPEGLSAVVAGRVTVSIGYDGLAGLRREPARCLDGMDVYELLFPGPWFELSYSVAGGFTFALLQVGDYALNLRNSVRKLLLLQLIKTCW